LLWYDAAVPRVRSRSIRALYWLVLAASAVLVFATAWILVPAPNILLLIPGVGAPELSPALLALSLAMVVIAGLYGRTLGTARLALVCSLVSAVLCAWPVVQVPSTLRRFDEAVKHAPGAESQKIPGARLRYLDLFRPPAAPPSRLVHAVPFTSHDGVPLTLDIYEPLAGQGPFPIVLQVYGGAWRSGTPADSRWFAQYFASRGYLVIAVDYRHAPRWKWPAQRDDVRDALLWSRAHAREFGGDPTRMILLGRSSGAQLALVAAYQDASPSIKAVISYYGPVDLAEGWRRPPVPDPLHVRDLLEAFLGGTPAQVPERYRDASPVTYVTKNLPPTLLIYGRRDHIVEARFGEQLDRALTRAGNTSVLLELPWSEHVFDLIPNGLGGQISLSYTEQFIRWALR
jgi:acetyl esterase/lipase